MKKLKVIFATFAVALVALFVTIELTNLLFEYEVARFVVIIPSLVIGMNARKVAEKLLGFTLEQATKEDKE